MPRRKRSSKLRSDSEVVEMFLHNGGWGATLLTGQPAFDDKEEAAAAWELCRATTWNHPHRDRRHPPRAAVLHDGISRHAIDLLGRASAGEVREAATADASSIEVFRRERPGAARTIAEHLDAYLEAIATAVSIAEVTDQAARDAALHRFQTVGGA